MTPDPTSPKPFDPVELMKLAERCEQASGPDREIDAEIAVAAAGFFVCAPRWDGGPLGYGYIDEHGHRVEPGHGGDQLVRKYTASLDAAMTLVPEDCGFVIHQPVGKKPSVALQFGREDYSAPKTVDGWGDYSSAATPALAIAAACLRARALLAEQGEG